LKSIKEGIVKGKDIGKSRTEVMLEAGLEILNRVELWGVGW